MGGGDRAPLFYDIGGEWLALHPSRFSSGKRSEWTFWRGETPLFLVQLWSYGSFPRCVFINYNWINQLSNTTIWWLDICCLLHRYQLHISALMAIFRLTDWQQTCKQLYFGLRLVYGGGGLGLDGGTRSRVCWVGRVMWVHGYSTTCFGSYGHLQVDGLTTNL